MPLPNQCTVSLAAYLFADNNIELNALSDAVEGYEDANGQTPDPPKTLRVILKVEIFKRQIR